jgi:predicted metalloprotease with PDZ domain
MRSGPNEFVAPSYDVLVDCPTIVSPHPNVANFTVNGLTYHLVIDGIGNYDVNKLAPVAKQIVGSEIKMMGHAGYKEYWAIFLAGSGGGMEHLNSTLSGISAFGWEQPHDSSKGAFRASNWNYFALVLAHEHFHSWNVKRIRPVVLGPFRYDREVHTRRLDVAEGFTEYYTYVHGLRSGFSTPAATWSEFADDVDTEENSPGRRLFSLGDLSWNTWWDNDDPYIPGGDYYDGAAVMAFMLDFKIRHDTNNAHSLDDVLRYLFADWEAKSTNQFQSTGGTYADDALPSIIVKATGDEEASALFHTWWDTTTLPDWNSYLQYAGLKLVKTMPKAGTATLDADWSEIGAPGGVGFRPRAGKLSYGYPTVNPDVVMFTRVLPGGAADRSGIQQFDVLQSLGGLGVTQVSLPGILAVHKPGDRLSASVLRDGRTVFLTVALGQDRAPTYAISPRKDATAAEKLLLKNYESGEPFGK